jgi:predicted enzyme related to lactoylglutathione lyase
MAIKARFVHTNIVAQDWKGLARFYEQVLGCTPLPPERNISGAWLDDATGLPGAQIRGIHLRLPGHGVEGPTLEIFQYLRHVDRPHTAINRPGLAHLAFAVDDVEAAREAILEAGGSSIGKTTTVQIPGAGTITFIYLTDPEGNILELQRWHSNSQR